MAIQDQEQRGDDTERVSREAGQLHGLARQQYLIEFGYANSFPSLFNDHSLEERLGPENLKRLKQAGDKIAREN
jgi:hypothetical protein